MQLGPALANFGAGITSGINQQNARNAANQQYQDKQTQQAFEDSQAQAELALRQAQQKSQGDAQSTAQLNDILGRVSQAPDGATALATVNAFDPTDTHGLAKVLIGKDGAALPVNPYRDPTKDTSLADQRNIQALGNFQKQVSQGISLPEQIALANSYDAALGTKFFRQMYGINTDAPASQPNIATGGAPLPSAPQLRIPTPLPQAATEVIPAQGPPSLQGGQPVMPTISTSTQSAGRVWNGPQADQVLAANPPSATPGAPLPNAANVLNAHAQDIPAPAPALSPSTPLPTQFQGFGPSGTNAALIQKNVAAGNASNATAAYKTGVLSSVVDLNKSRTLLNQIHGNYYDKTLEPKVRLLGAEADVAAARATDMPEELKNKIRQTNVAADKAQYYGQWVQGILQHYTNSDTTAAGRLQMEQNNSAFNQSKALPQDLAAYNDTNKQLATAQAQYDKLKVHGNDQNKDGTLVYPDAAAQLSVLDHRINGKDGLKDQISAIQARMPTVAPFPTTTPGAAVPSRARAAVPLAPALPSVKDIRPLPTANFPGGRPKVTMRPASDPRIGKALQTLSDITGELARRHSKK